MKERLTILMIVALAVGVLAPTAQAAMFLRLSDDGGVSWATVADGDGDGVITYSGAIGNWTVNVTTALSKPLLVPGGANDPWLDLNSVNVSSSSAAAGTLTIMATDTDFLPGQGWTSTALKSDIGGTTNGTVTLKQVLDLGNLEFQEAGDLNVELGPFSAGAFSGSDTAFGAWVSGPFSLTEIAVISHGSGVKSTSFDATSAVVPVPGAVLLGLLGLSAAGLKLRRFA